MKAISASIIVLAGVHAVVTPGSGFRGLVGGSVLIFIGLVQWWRQFSSPDSK